MDLKIEDVLLRIRDQLNKDQVKLWLPPYTVNDESSENDHEDTAFQELIEKYSSLLNIDETSCGVALRELKDHALTRLKEREVFRQTGLATIKVRVSGNVPRTLTIQVLLDETAAQLTDKIAEKLEIDINRIKLISGGKVLENSKDLGSQGLKNGIQIMAVILTENLTELQEVEKRMKTLDRTKKDLEYLAGRSSSDDANYYFDLEDQSGKRLSLPPEEQKALIMAMTLHEKGRAALKREDYALALVLLLEADKEFSACNSALLPKVDNYALLHLDVAWCYLCLRNVTQIPDAEAKLKQCEANFHASYGPNLERLMALKGTTGNEAALFMRLHLLQGVVFYHQNKREEAKRLFERASNELKALKVDDESLSTLIELVFSDMTAVLSWPTRQSRDVKSLSGLMVLGSRRRSPVRSSRYGHHHQTKVFSDMTAVLSWPTRQSRDVKSLSGLMVLGSRRRSPVRSSRYGHHHQTKVFSDMTAVLSWPTRQSRDVKSLSGLMVLGSRRRSPVRSSRYGHHHQTKGLSPAEARLGLRATNGNIEAAVDLIHRKRQEREEALDKNRKEQELERIRKKFGKCADGKQWVEMEFVKKLVGMGYSYNLAAAALKHTNNIISDAVQVIQDRPHILAAAIESPVISSEMVNQVIGMGFDQHMAKIALRKHKGNVESAVEELIAFGGIIEGEILDNSDEDNEEQEKRRKKDKKAFDRLSEGLATEADDYLDLTLVQEEQFLNEYLSLIC